MRSERLEPSDLSADAEVVVELACEALTTMSAEQERDGLRRLRIRFAQRAPEGHGRLWLFGSGAIGALGCALLIVWSLVRHPAAMSYSVAGATQIDQGFVRSTASDNAAVRFSDGSIALLKGETRLRIAEVGRTGAKIALEEGVLHLDIVHKDGADWRVQAGPFQVLVKGTAFSLAWAGETGRMKLDLERGSVWVSGPLSEGPIVLRAGQSLTMSLPEKQVLVEEAASVAPPSGAPAGEGVLAAAEPDAGELPAASEAVSAESKPSLAALARKPSWTAYLAAGRFTAILEEADQRGLEASLSERGSDDLAALADAARYLGRAPIARRALLTLRSRFPRTTRAEDSAFLLGRLDESSQPRSAIAWYDRYIEEAPTGVYASAALGRKMTATKQLDGIERARPIAEQYLKRYPTGAYGTLAQAIVRNQ